MAVVEQARYEYTGDGVTREFPIVFPYLRDSDVVVQVDGQNVAYTFSPGNSFVRLEEVPSAGSEVAVQRSTEARYPLHEFQHGSPLVPGYLDENLKQVLYVAQELVYESEETRDVADAALQTVQDALDTASNGVDIANNADSAASVAVGTANQALQQAGVAEGIAQAAALDASTAVDTAGTAAADAAAALSVAGTASSAAQTAVQVAEGIDSKATQALSESGDAVARVEQLEDVVTDLESGGVTNFNGRTGTVVPEAGDYSYDQIAGLQDQLDSKVGLDDSVQTSGNQTISGTKTFSQFPVTPTAAPTSDYQATNKKYVDDKVSGAAQKSANLSDLASAPAARQNLGLGTAATRDVGTSSGNVMEVGAFGLGATAQNGQIRSWVLPQFQFGHDGITDEYLVLFPSKVAGPHGIKGEFHNSRGSSDSGNIPSVQFINAQTADSSNTLISWVKGPARFLRFSILSISGTDYVAMKADTTGGPAHNQNVFYGNVIGGDSRLFTRVRGSDPDVSVVTDTAALVDYIHTTGNILTTTGQSTVFPMSQKAVTDAINNSAIGVGQTWQAVTGSRDAGITYTNTTGRTIVVSVRSDVYNGHGQITVGGLAVAASGNTSGLGHNRHTVCAIVPNGVSYSYDGSAIVLWAELR